MPEDTGVPPISEGEMEATAEEDAAPAEEGHAAKIIATMESGLSGITDLVLLVGSGVLIFATFEADAQDSWLTIYAYIASSVSLFVSLIALFMKLRDNKWLAYFFAIWWLPAAALFTQNGPFTASGNGYLVSWALALASLANMRKHTGDSFTSFEACLDDDTTTEEQNLKHILFISSGVVFWATLNKDMAPWANLWATICSGTSLFITLLWHIPYIGKLISTIDAPACVFLGLWWAVGTFTMTFHGPFQTTGNGFLGAWVAGVTAIMLVQYQFKDELAGLFGPSSDSSEGEGTV